MHILQDAPPQKIQRARSIMHRRTFGSDDLELGCFGSNRSYKVFPKELQVPFVSNVAFRSPLSLPMPPLPTPPVPTPPQLTPALQQAENAEGVAEETLTEQPNVSVIGLINQRVTRSQSRATSNRAEV